VIRYEPNPHWIRDIRHFPVSYALRRAVSGMVGMGIYSIALVWTMETLAGDFELPHGAAAFGLFGGVISLALAFRLNNAYARWWEARQHWGLLVNHSRNFAAIACAQWPADDTQGRRRLAGLLGDFAVGLAMHLRGELKPEHLESLGPKEREEVNKRSHPLSYVSHLVWAEIEKQRGAGNLDTAQQLQLQPHARGLLDVLGACERIRNTPIPFAVTAAARLFLLVFAILIPLGLHQEFGHTTIALAMAAYFALAVMDVLAAELENPFGLDCNDLPTRSMGEMIRRQVFEILGSDREGSPDTEPVAPQLYSKIH
jgi:putative membrane protein